MRGPRRAGIAGLVLVLAGVTTPGQAGGASRLEPPRGSPDPKLMVLRTSDVHARIEAQGYFRDADFPSTISYSREFGDGRVGASRFTSLQSDAEIGRDARTTSSFLAYLRRTLASKQGRAALRERFAEGLGEAEAIVSDLRIGRPRALGAGSGSFDLPLSVEILGRRTDAHFAVFRVERILGVLLAVGEPGTRFGLRAISRLAKLMAARMDRQLVPHNLALPVVSGTPQVGQTLTASPGSWTERPAAFAYRWQRCNAGGANCRIVAGVAGQSYGLTAADAGSTIRVSVTARNAFGSRTARSAPTAAVRAAAVPVNTALPAISGTTQVGQTLTATTGTWTGSPTAFAFQWQRCDAAGAICATIAGATGATYLVGSADAGATLRVAVTATNAMGSATAVSAQTAPVS